MNTRTLAAPTVDEPGDKRVQRWPSTGGHGRRSWLMRRMLLTADLLGLSVSFVVVDFVYLSQGPRDAVAFNTEFLVFFLSLPGWIVLAKLYGLYNLDEERADHSTADELLGVFHLITVGAFLFYAGSWLSGLVRPTPGKIITFWVLAIVAITSARGLARVICRRQPAYTQATVILGAGDVGQLIARKLLRHREYGLDILGFVDAMPKERHPGLGDLAVIGVPDDLPALVDEYGIDRVIVAFSNDHHEQTLKQIRMLAELDVCVDVVPRFFPIIGRGVGVSGVEGLPLVSLPRPRLARSSLFVKRALDLSFSALGLLLLSPVFAVIALKLKRDSPGSVFFRQTRMGADDRPFEMFKFRTMTLDADKRKQEVSILNKHTNQSGDTKMFKVPNDPRVTRFGRSLRRYSLDELPQLLNVLRGDMSLVGPRPLILEEDRHVVDWGRRRQLVKPGMTGLWQVFGRDDIPFEEMVELDYLYVVRWSLLTDLKLLIRTLPAIARHRVPC